MKYTVCCKEGKINLPTPPSDAYIEELLQGITSEAKLFLNNSNFINSRVSVGEVHMDQQFLGSFPPTLRVHNHVYTTMESNFNYLRTFFFDSDAEKDISLRSVPPAVLHILKKIQEILLLRNPFHKAIKVAVDSDKVPRYKLVFSDTAIADEIGLHRGVLNAPTSATQIGMIMDDVLGTSETYRSLTVEFGSNRTTIKSSNMFYDAAAYAIYNIDGLSSWHPYLKNDDGSKITCLDYYRYKAHSREEHDIVRRDLLLHGGKVSLQFWVDMFMKIEEERLDYIRFHQATLKAHLYQKTIDQDSVTAIPRVILPATFEGSPRNVIANYQDVMAICSDYGKPTFFLTFTCNPNWIEIQENLKDGQSAWMRPDLVVRVFKMKLEMLIADITKNHIFGRAKCKVEVVEFQKRGLPHAHILIIMDGADVPCTPEQFDNIIAAEFPSSANPLLREIITSDQFHNPCGSGTDAPCMEEGKCKRNFPKDFVGETVNANENDYYPTYRRRDIESTTFVSARGKKIDNRWCVPYSPYLSLKYKAHLNVEICVSYGSVKYLYKYVYKGPDMVAYSVLPEAQKEDEILKYQAARFITPPEAMWRIFGFPISSIFPTVERLSIHDETEDNENSKLLAYFALVRRERLMPPTARELRIDSRSSKDLKYAELPQLYTWVSGSKSWKRREKHAQVNIRYKLQLERKLTHVPLPQHKNSFQGLAEFTTSISTRERPTLSGCYCKNGKE